MADISATLVSKSDQLDNVDLMGGPRTFTIAGVTVNEGAEQPLSIHLVEYGRPWKPGVTMRRLLAELWGVESDSWVGRQVRLYRDDAVTFGKTKPGGTRISHATHIDKPTTVTLPTSQGKFGEFKVQPLIESAPTTKPEPTAEQVAACTDPDILRGWWKSSGPERRAQIEARVAEITGPKTDTPPADDASLNTHWDTTGAQA